MQITTISCAFVLIGLHKSHKNATRNPGKNFCVMVTEIDRFFHLFPPQGLTLIGFCDKFAPYNSCDEDMPWGKALREDAMLVKGIRAPATEIPLLSRRMEISGRVRPLPRQ